MASVAAAIVQAVEEATLLVEDVAEAASVTIAAMTGMVGDAATAVNKATLLANVPTTPRAALLAAAEAATKAPVDEGIMVVGEVTMAMVVADEAAFKAIVDLLSPKFNSRRAQPMLP